MSVFVLSSFSIFSLAHADGDVPRFLEVSSKIYRSGRPEDKKAMKWLVDNYDIKTIIDLEDNESAVKQEKNWAKDLKIEFKNFPMSASKDPKDEDVDAIMDLLADSSNFPILVHCKHGRDRTGMIIGIHRVENENWDSHKSYDEMLELGFRNIFYKLDRYYKNRTNY